MPVDILVRLGRRVRYLRTSRGISQEVLASRAYLTRTALSRIENGKADLRIKNLAAIAKALGLKITDIVSVLD